MTFLCTTWNYLFFGFSPFSTNWLNFSRYLGLNLHTTCIKLKSSKSFLFLCIVCNKNNDNAVHATLLPTYLTIDSHLRFNFQILESHGIIPWIWPCCIRIDISKVSKKMIFIPFSGNLQIVYLMCWGRSFWQQQTNFFDKNNNK